MANPSISRLADLTAVILVGGRGTRLQPAVSDRPKVLAPVAGRPFLEWVLDQLIDSGIRRVVLCTGHRRQLLNDAFGDHYGDCKIQYSDESQPLGTAGALRRALSQVESNPVLAMNGCSSVVASKSSSEAAWCQSP